MRNYVLLRRFSAKEERRRLTASWLLRAEESRPYLALENHLNYVYHADRELTAEETYGLTALFNSALLDKYFRVISGNTQVNATELRSIRFPALDRVAAIGERLKALGAHEPAAIERIVLEVLGVNGPVGAYALEEAFLSISDFRKYAADIAWETEVWMAATPDHMIHFNGPKFLGPHNPQHTG